MARLTAELHSAVASTRRARGLTQRHLAAMAEVSRQTIVELEKGSYNPSTALALRLAVLLETRVEDLFWLPEVKAGYLRRQRERLAQQRVEEPTHVPPANLAAVEADDRHRT